VQILTFAYEHVILPGRASGGPKIASADLDGALGSSDALSGVASV
jgi:hypothetical protein